MSRYAMCPHCGHRMLRYKEFGVWDGQSYWCPYCAGDDEDDYDDDENGDGCYSVYDAALAWASSGMDEDYTFGYTVEELEEALRRG